MVQEFYVLKCYSCELYQVHIVKKAKKWACKVCGSKQSLVKVYGQGSAKDCRLHVQKLNNHSNDPNSDNQFLNDDQSSSLVGELIGYENYSLETEYAEEEYVQGNASLKRDSNERPISKWTKYLEPKDGEVLELEQFSPKRYQCNSPHSGSFTIEADGLANGFQLEKSHSFKTKIVTEKNVNQSNNEEFKLKDNKVLKFFSEDELDIDAVLDL